MMTNCAELQEVYKEDKTVEEIYKEITKNLRNCSVKGCKNPTTIHLKRRKKYYCVEHFEARNN